jgi:hypothetical protein
MPQAGTAPIYCATPAVRFASSNILGASANTALDGSGTPGTDYNVVFTAGAAGSYLKRLRFKAGVSASATTLTVVRAFLNNGSSIGTAANNVFLDDLTLPATTPSITGASPVYFLSFEMPIPAGYQVFIKFATASANGWQVLAEGGDY